MNTGLSWCHLLVRSNETAITRPRTKQKKIYWARKRRKEETDFHKRWLPSLTLPWVSRVFKVKLQLRRALWGMKYTKIAIKKCLEWEPKRMGDHLFAKFYCYYYNLGNITFRCNCNLWILKQNHAMHVRVLSFRVEVTRIHSDNLKSTVKVLVPNLTSWFFVQPAHFRDPKCVRTTEKASNSATCSAYKFWTSGEVLCLSYFKPLTLTSSFKNLMNGTDWISQRKTEKHLKPPSRQF